MTAALGGPLLGLLVVLAAAPVPETDVDFPHPPLAAFEPVVAATLQDARAQLQRARAGTDAAAQARAWGQLAMVYHAHQQFDAARAGYRRAKQLAPADRRWPYLEAVVEQEAGRYGRAIKLFSAGLRGGAQDGPALLRRGQAQLALGRYAQARQSFRSALKVVGDSAAAHAGLGRTALRERRVDEAIEHLEAALRAEPAATQLRRPLALAYRQRGETQKARRLLAQGGEGKAVLRDPLVAAVQALSRSSQYFLDRGAAAARAGQPQRAADFFRQAIAADADRAAAYVSLGRALEELGRPTEAATQYTLALQKDAGQAVAHYRLGVLREQAGDEPAAFEHYRAAVAGDPSQAGPRYLLAHALMRRGEYAAAAGHYARIAEDDPANATARYREGLAHLAGGRCAAAMAAFARAVRGQPNEGAFLQARARNFAACPQASAAQRAQALDDARRLVAARGNPAHLETLAMAYAANGDFEKARGVQGRVLETLRGPRRAAAEFQLRRYVAGQRPIEAWPTSDEIFAPRALRSQSGPVGSGTPGAENE